MENGHTNEYQRNCGKENKLVRILDNIFPDVVFTFIVMTLSLGMVRLEYKIQNLESKLTTQTQDILEGELNDKFYDFGGERAYLEIDGQSIESYFEDK